MNVKKLNDQTIAEAASILGEGGVVVVPTDTNYNVVTSPFSKTGVERIFAMKNRDRLSPLTLFLGDSLEMADYAYSNPAVDRLAKRLWPEKITFIVEQKATLPGWVTCGYGTVGVTLHAHSGLRAIAQRLGTPLAGTSANLSGTGNVPNVEKAIEHIGSSVDLVVDAGLSPVDSANTIVDFTFNPPILARLGAFPIEPLVELVPNLELGAHGETYKSRAKARVVESEAGA